LQFQAATAGIKRSLKRFFRRTCLRRPKCD
jgi:hypothetical protein